MLQYIHEKKNLLECQNFWAGPKTIEFICTIKNELLSRQKNFLSGKLLCCSHRQDFWCISRTLFATVAYLDKYEDRQKTNMTNVWQYEIYDIFLVANSSQTYSIIVSMDFNNAGFFPSIWLANFRDLNLIFHIQSMSDKMHPSKGRRISCSWQTIKMNE